MSRPLLPTYQFIKQYHHSYSTVCMIYNLDTINSWIRVREFSNQLDPRGRVFLKILILTHLVKEFPAFYGTRSFIMFRTSRHRSLSWVRYIQSTSSNPISLISILILPSHLCLSLPSGILTFDSQIKILFAYIIWSMHHAFPTHLIFHDLPKTGWS